MTCILERRQVIERQEVIDKPSGTLLGDFNMPLGYGQDKQIKVSKDLEGWNNKSNQFDLQDFDRTPHAIIGEYTFFLSAHGTL